MQDYKMENVSVNMDLTKMEHVVVEKMQLAWMMKLKQMIYAENVHNLCWDVIAVHQILFVQVV